jgi:hypothetical protein
MHALKSKGARGKFFKPGTAINSPVYLDAEVQAYLSARMAAIRVRPSSVILCDLVELWSTASL